MSPERKDQHQGRQRRRNEKPRPVPAPPRMCFVAQRPDHRVIDSIPESGEQHQRRYCSHTDPEYIRVKYHQEISYKHPAEIAAHISHAVCDLADQRHLYICCSLFHALPTLLPVSNLSYSPAFSPSLQIRMTAFTMSALLFTL